MTRCMPFATTLLVYQLEVPSLSFKVLPILVSSVMSSFFKIVAVVLFGRQMSKRSFDFAVGSFPLNAPEIDYVCYFAIGNSY